MNGRSAMTGTSSVRAASTLLTAVALAALSGCSTVDGLTGDAKIDYRTQAKKTNPLEVPPDLSQLGREGRLRTPTPGAEVRASTMAATAATPAAGTATVAPGAVQGMRIVRQGNQRWLLVPATDADTLWPKLSAFWTGIGFTLEVENRTTGVMETSWAENRAKLPQDMFRATLGRLLEGLYSTGERDRFRTRIERVDGGISDFGVSIVERMNEVGMAVDVSHSGDRTTLDACELSRKPVLFTHSNARALNPGHPRCKTDEAIRRMAATGGVMGITGVRMFVKGDEPTTVEHYAAHFDHVRDLVGVEHLGIGSDIDLHGYDDMPAKEYENLKAQYKGSYGFRDKIDIEGIDHPKRMFDVTEALIRRGYADDHIRGILGGNLQRVLGEIWGA